MLDLGPLHNEVLTHIQQIINTPDLLVGSKVSHTTGALYGQEWETPELFSTVKAMADKMPHLKQLVVVFSMEPRRHGRGSLQSSHLVELLMKQHLKRRSGLDASYQ